MEASSIDYRASLDRVSRLALSHYDELPHRPVHPSRTELDRSRDSIHAKLPESGLSLHHTLRHLVEDICPGLSGSPSPRYFGFVTGGATPAAQMADMLTTIHDQNVQVHLPQCSVSTAVEVAALDMVLDLLRCEPSAWPGKTLTTGATASNLLGLACGRDAVLTRLGIDAAEDGLADARVQVLCASAHASIKKAASLAGLGRRNCLEVQDPADPYGVSFDLDRLEAIMRQNKEDGIGSIVVASLGEVNTGLFTPGVARLRRLCDTHDGWLHVDAAFAIFAGVYEPLSPVLGALQFADSICVDGHKWLSEGKSARTVPLNFETDVVQTCPTTAPCFTHVDSTCSNTSARAGRRRT